MSINKAKIQEAFELLNRANSLIQGAGIPQPEAIEEDPVYTIHNIIENAIMEIEDVLDMQVPEYFEEAV
jgi:hypothetical protein